MGAALRGLSDVGRLIGFEVAAVADVLHAAVVAPPRGPRDTGPPRLIPAVGTATPRPRPLRPLVINRAPSLTPLPHAVIRPPRATSVSVRLETGTRDLARAPEVPPTWVLHEGGVRARSLSRGEADIAVDVADALPEAPCIMVADTAHTRPLVLAATVAVSIPFPLVGDPDTTAARRPAPGIHAGGEEAAPRLPPPHAPVVARLVRRLTLLGNGDDTALQIVPPSPPPGDG